MLDPPRQRRVRPPPGCCPCNKTDIWDWGKSRADSTGVTCLHTALLTQTAKTGHSEPTTAKTFVCGNSSPARSYRLFFMDRITMFDRLGRLCLIVGVRIANEHSINPHILPILCRYGEATS